MQGKCPSQCLKLKLHILGFYPKYSELVSSLKGKSLFGLRSPGLCWAPPDFFLILPEDLVAITTSHSCCYISDTA